MTMLNAIRKKIPPTKTRDKQRRKVNARRKECSNCENNKLSTNEVMSGLVQGVGQLEAKSANLNYRFLSMYLSNFFNLQIL